MKPRDDRVAGIVLASGLSRRLAGENKLLLPVGGRTVVHWTVSAYVDAGLDPVIVVIGHEAEAVRAALSDLPVAFVSNPDFALGQSRSLVRGVMTIPRLAPAAVIGVGDQPLLTPSVIRELCTSFEKHQSLLVVPRYAGRRGNPVLFARSLLSELIEVVGDVGGRPVVERHIKGAAWVDVHAPEVGLDIDTREAYVALTSMFPDDNLRSKG